MMMMMMMTDWWHFCVFRNNLHRVHVVLISQHIVQYPTTACLPQTDFITPLKSDVNVSMVAELTLPLVRYRCDWIAQTGGNLAPFKTENDATVFCYIRARDGMMFVGWLLNVPATG